MNRWLLIGSAVLSLQAQSAQPLVPAELVASARLSPMDFVATLANGSIPSGIEIRSADTTVSLVTWTKLTSSEPAAFGSGRLDASLLITTFNQSHDDYRAEIIDGVIVVRPVRNRSAFLDRPSTLRPIEVKGMMAALRMAFDQLDPALSRAGARAGSYLGGVPRDIGDDIAVRLDGTNRSIVGLLNDLVRQAPRAWVVETAAGAPDPRIEKIGFLLRAGAGTFETLSQPPAPI